MKLFEVLELQNFYSLIKDAKLPIRTTYKLTRLMRQVEQEIQFYQTEFAKIVEEYALKENGQYVYSDDMASIKIIAGKEEECGNKILELKNLDVDLSDFSFSIDEFEGLDLTISQLNSIIPLITD